MNLIIDGLQSARLLAMKELNRHLYAGFLREAEQTGDQYIIQKTRQQAVNSEAEHKDAAAEI